MIGYGTHIGARGPTDRRYAAAWRYTEAAEGNEETGKGSGGDRSHATIAWGVDIDEDEKDNKWLVEYDTEGDYRPARGAQGARHIWSRRGWMSRLTFDAVMSRMRDLFEELGDGELLEMVDREWTSIEAGRALEVYEEGIVGGVCEWVDWTAQAWTGSNSERGYLRLRQA